MQFVSPQRGEFANSLPQAYYDEMRPIIERVTATWFSDNDRAQGYDRYIIDHFVYGRMEQCQTSVMPWINRTIATPSRKRVLEIGCGTGPSTVPIARSFGDIIATDIDRDTLEVAEKRCSLLAVDNVSFRVCDTSWIDSYHENPRSIVEEDVDVIFCYALIEHLLPTERIKFLRGAWKHLPIGGHLIIIECPNRLNWFDWHSSKLPFADQLPEELAFLYFGQSERASIWHNIKARTLSDLANCSRDSLYRFGRGASFHEFYIALDPNSFRIVSGGGVPRAQLEGSDPDWTALLARKLGSTSLNIPAEFAAPCLDLIIEKTASI